MKKILEDFLYNNFPNSELATSFCEINTTVNLAIDLGLYPKINQLEQSDFAFDRSIKVFSKIFDKHEPIWILVNEWNLSNICCSISYFKNKSPENCVSWKSFDKSAEIEREQTFLIKQHEEIDLVNLFTALINSQTGAKPMLDSRIYFINPVVGIIFILWDGMITIESNDYNKLKPIYVEFEKFIGQKNI